MAQRAALGRIMDSRRKLLFRATSKILQAVEVATAMVEVVMVTTHHRMPQVTAAVEAGEVFPIFPAFRLNSQTFSVVLGSEEETTLEMRLS